MELSKTQSLCPTCFRRIDASIVASDEGVHLKKSCPEHGAFEALIWNGSPDDYLSWLETAGPLGACSPSGPHVPSDAGCPFCCGLCDLHESETFTAALMVTSRCNLSCPVCFSHSGTSPDPTFDELARRLEFYRETSGGPFPLELCGGEPTIRDDLDEIARHAKSLGFSHIQLNTNGVRIGSEEGYADHLAESGIDTVYLSFDGLEDEAYRKTCGESLLDVKTRAVENLCKHDIGIVLVPIVTKDTTARALGAILRFALEHVPHVRGVNIQPFARLGRYSRALGQQQRMTIPDVLSLIEEATEGAMDALDFMPGGVEHALCSFQATYLVGKDGTLRALAKRHARTNNDGACAKVRATMPAQWQSSFLPALTVGGMIFQDAYNVDIERLKRCPTHIIGDGLIYPLCAKYLTSETGSRLYDGID